MNNLNEKKSEMWKENAFTIIGSNGRMHDYNSGVEGGHMEHSQKRADDHWDGDDDGDGDGARPVTQAANTNIQTDRRHAALEKRAALWNDAWVEDEPVACSGVADKCRGTQANRTEEGGLCACVCMSVLHATHWRLQWQFGLQMPLRH